MGRLILKMHTFDVRIVAVDKVTHSLEFGRVKGPKTAERN